MFVSIFDLCGVSALKTAIYVVPNELSIAHQIHYIANIVGVAVDPVDRNVQFLRTFHSPKELFIQQF